MPRACAGCGVKQIMTEGHGPQSASATSAAFDRHDGFLPGHQSNHSRGLLHGQAGSGKEVPVAGAPCGPELKPPKATSVTPDTQRDADLVSHEGPRYEDAGEAANRPDQLC